MRKIVGFLCSESEKVRKGPIGGMRGFMNGMRALRNELHDVCRIISTSGGSMSGGQSKIRIYVLVLKHDNFFDPV